METKNCQNCKNDFVIDEAAINFYTKINVPGPTWCSTCRLARRFSFLNPYNIYKRSCSKCEKTVMSIYNPDNAAMIYCNQCWWSDSWDGTEFAMDYDPAKPFLQQVYELRLKTPWAAVTSLHTSNVNCEYTNALAHCKDSYMIFWADYCENALYSEYLNGLKDSSDCYRAKESELCYEGVGINKCYRTFFSEECDSCTDVWFSRACAGCVNCIGCINLRNKSYCIFNEQYSREDYLAKVKEMNLDTRSGIEKIKQEARAFWLTKPNRVYIGNSLNVGVTGDYIYESKNAQDIYLASGAEDSRYTSYISVPSAKDCYDYTGWGNGAELIYECAVVGEGASNVKFCNECWPAAQDVEYSIYAISSKNCFGCVNVKHKSYCILNKQYTKEEYENLKAHIIDDMKKNPYIDPTGKSYFYGEFFPMNFSHFAYNDTLAQNFLPKTKDQAIAEGLRWYEGKPNEYAITVKAENLPDSIASTPAEIIKEIIECAQCKKAYRLVQDEVNFLKKAGLPVPDRCYKCRQYARFARTNKPMLYDRQCSKCHKDIKTSYSPDRPEIVYCETCYQQEIS